MQANSCLHFVSGYDCPLLLAEMAKSKVLVGWWAFTERSPSASILASTPAAGEHTMLPWSEHVMQFLALVILALVENPCYILSGVKSSQAHIVKL